jgi:hypothetical protein
MLCRLGELYEAKGNREKAIDYYQRFVNEWKDADRSYSRALRRFVVAGWDSRTPSAAERFCRPWAAAMA